MASTDHATAANPRVKGRTDQVIDLSRTILAALSIPQFTELRGHHQRIRNIDVENTYRSGKAIHAGDKIRCEFSGVIRRVAPNQGDDMFCLAWEKRRADF